MTKNARTQDGIRLRVNGLVAFSLMLLLAFFQPGNMSLNAYAQQASSLHIAIVDGNDRADRKGDGRRLIVEVRDDSRLPVGGADVTFIAPDFGPGILFAGNANRLTVKTDSAGRADAGLTRPVGDGTFLIQIVANHQGQTASASAQGDNQSPTPATSGDKKKSSKLKWILIAAAAGTAGVVLATKKSGSDSGGSGSPGGGTITLGSPTVGAPQ